MMLMMMAAVVVYGVLEAVTGEVRRPSPIQ
jgi:hypothetical protein